MQRIQVRQKRRPEPLPRVANTTTLKAKEHFFGEGTAAHGGGAPVPFPVLEAAVHAAAGAVAAPGAATAKICVSMCRFSAISAVATLTAATGSGARTDRRRHPVEGARGSPAAHKRPHAKKKQHGHLQA
jgi:hypothetical protein